ncbi:MAG: TonB-dependent receptor [Planctomycetales bacterium]
MSFVPGAPVFVQGMPNNNVEAEDVVSYEFGARSQPSEAFFWDVAVFLNDYSDLVAFNPSGPPTAPPPPFVGLAVPLQFENDPAHRMTWGGELATTVKPTDDWDFRLAYSYVRGERALTDLNGSPRNLLYFNSGHDLGCDWELNVIGRYQDLLPSDPGGVIPSAPVSPYFEMDAQLTWQPLRDLEFNLVGRNLLQRSHFEAPADPSSGIVNPTLREFYGGVTYRY